MHLVNTIHDLHIKFQASIMSRSEENHLRVSRKSQYLWNDFSILSHPISQKWFQSHSKPLLSAIQRCQPFEKIPTRARDMNFWMKFVNFLRKTPGAYLPKAVWRHYDVIRQNKFQIHNLLCQSFDLSIHKPTFGRKSFNDPLWPQGF